MKKILIIGYGSIGKKHALLINKYFPKFEIYLLTSQIEKKYKNIKSLNEIIEIDPDFIILSSETHKHYKQLAFIEDNFSNKKILIEKPLFDKKYYLKIKKNKVFVAFNLRFHPLILFLKQSLNNEKIISVNIRCLSNLPKWRKNIDYRKSYSSFKSKGGGVILDLSHELDYLTWLFGDIKSFSKNVAKISDLEINSEDYAAIIGKTKKNIFFNLTLNYFSQKDMREILIDGHDFTIYIDLIKSTYIKYTSSKLIKKIFSVKDINLTYKLQLNSFLGNKHSHLCSYKEGLSLVNVIDKLKR